MKQISTKVRRKQIHNYSTNIINELYCYKIQLKVFGLFWVTIKRYHFADLRCPGIRFNKGNIIHIPTPNFRL